MASFLNIENALPLDQLLSQVNTEGLVYSIVASHTSNALPKITGIGSLHDATSHEISFLANPNFFKDLASTKAAAVILPQKVIKALPGNSAFAIIQCEDPYLLYARITQLFDAIRCAHHNADIHESAIIHPSARIGNNVSIHALAVVHANAIISDGTIIGSGSVIGEGCKIGRNTKIYANVTLYHDVEIGEHCIIHSGAVIGADGFGFAPDHSKEKGAWCKIAQLGTVILQDDVEIGANTTIDRGALTDTIIRRGVKLDNQIMVGHNCDIGEHTAMAACVGIAGSSKIGKRCTLAGASMVSGHITLGDDVHISGGTGVLSNIDKPGRYTGLWPIMDHQSWQKNAATLTQLYELRRRIQSLEKALEAKILNDE